MRFTALCFLYLACCLTVWAAPESGGDAAEAKPALPAPTAEPCPECRPEDWQGQLGQVRDQLGLLGLFAKATSLGGVTVKVPRELQRIPLEMMEGTEDIVRAGIEVYLKEVRFQNLRLDHDETPLWLEQRPLIAGLAAFDRLGVAIDARTKVGTFPVKCDLKQGALPFQFHCNQEKYDVGIAPPYRRDEAHIGDVRLDFGGPVASGLLTKLFGKKVTQLVLEAAAGQTFQLGQQDLLGGLPIGDVAPLSNTVDTLLKVLEK